MTDEIQFPLLCFSIAVALEKVAGNSSLWELDTQIHCRESNSDLAYSGVSSVYAAWSSLPDTKSNDFSSASGITLLFILEYQFLLKLVALFLASALSTSITWFPWLTLSWTTYSFQHM